MQASLTLYNIQEKKNSGSCELKKRGEETEAKGQKKGEGGLKARRAERFSSSRHASGTLDQEKR